MSTTEEVTCAGCRRVFERGVSAVPVEEVAAALGAEDRGPLCPSCVQTANTPVGGAAVPDDDDGGTTSGFAG